MVLIERGNVGGWGLLAETCGRGWLADGRRIIDSKEWGIMVVVAGGIGIGRRTAKETKTREGE